MYTLFRGFSKKEHQVAIVYDKDTGYTLMKPMYDDYFGYKVQKKVGKRTIEDFVPTAKRIDAFASHKKESYNRVDFFNTIGMIDTLAFSGCKNVEVVSYEGVDYHDKDTLIASLLENGVDCSLNLFEGSKIDVSFPCISYTSADDIPITPNTLEGFGAKITKQLHFKTMKQGKIIFDGEITTIPNSAFQGQSRLTSFVIPGSVTKIEKYAFQKCTGLTSIVIPEGVTYVGGYAFDGCSNVSSLIIGDSVTRIDAGAFYNNTKLADVTVGVALTEVSNKIENGTSTYQYPFDGCPNIKTLTYKEGCTNIVNTRIQSISVLNLPSTATKIASAAFRNCDALTTVDFPDSITTFGENSFSYCDGFETITLPDNVSNIANGVFSNCPKLASVVYRGKTYTNYYELMAAFEANDVICGTTAFSLTALDMSNPTPVLGSMFLYTSSDNEIITPTTSTGWGANIVGNVIE